MLIKYELQVPEEGTLPTEVRKEVLARMYWACGSIPVLFPPGTVEHMQPGQPDYVVQMGVHTFRHADPTTHEVDHQFYEEQDACYIPCQAWGSPEDQWGVKVWFAMEDDGTNGNYVGRDAFGNIYHDM